MLVLKLFPTPVAVFDFKDLSEEETSAIINTPKKNTGNSYLDNVSSSDKNILKNKKLKRLREAIQTCIDRYKNEVMSCDEELYMTNSWVNFLLPQQRHPMHYHSNSIVSGVYYIKTDEETPDLELEHPNTNLWRLTWKRKKFSHENNLSTFVKARDNRLVLFPSFYYHEITPIKSKTKKKGFGRYSISNFLSTKT